MTALTRSTLAEVCQALDDGDWIESKDQGGDDFRLLQVSNIGVNDFVETDNYRYITEETFNSLRCREVLPGHILISRMPKPIGRAWLVPEMPWRMVTAVDVAIAVPDEALVSPRFLVYALNAPGSLAYCEQRAAGATRPRITRRELATLPVWLPPRQVQDRIADVLYAYDNLIENNRRRLVLLEEATRQLYREWFVRLRFPGHEHTRITDGIPQGWERRPLADLADITMGQSPASSYYNENGEGLPFHQGVSDFGDRFVAHRVYSTALNRVAEAGDILCSVRAPVGRLNITLDKIVIGRGLAALRSKAGFQSLLFQQLCSHFFKEDLVGGGAIFASVTKKELSSQLLLDPPERLKRAYEEVSIPCDEQMRILHLQNYQLRTARDLLIPRLMSGTVAV